MSCEECLSNEFSYNSAKKELEEKIAELGKKLDISVSRETELNNRIKELEAKEKKFLSFISGLDNDPPFWYRTCKKSIRYFVLNYF